LLKIKHKFLKLPSKHNSV